MSAIQSVGSLASDITWGAVDGANFAGQWVLGQGKEWYAPIDRAISPVTTPLADYGWVASTYSAALVVLGTPFGVNRAVNAYDHLREGEVKEALVDGVLAAGSLGLVAFEVYALYLQFFGGEASAQSADDQATDGQSAVDQSAVDQFAVDQSAVDQSAGGQPAS